MNADFDRLFRLAKKTGDTLIIFDREQGEHQVIMSLDKYEDFVMDDKFLDAVDFSSRERTLSQEKQPQGNIAPETRDSFIEKEKPWHAAGAVLDNLYPEFNVAPNDSEDMLSSTGFGFEEDIKLNFEPPQEPQFQGKFVQTQSANESAPLEYDPLMQEPQPIPPASQQEQEADIYNEESLGEDPIFFEEPLA